MWGSVKTSLSAKVGFTVVNVIFWLISVQERGGKWKIILLIDCTFYCKLAIPQSAAEKYVM